MASVQDIIDAVVETTRRIDRTPFITTRVKMAIKHLHSRDFFPLDREELIVTNSQLTLTSDALIGQFDLPLRWRTFEAVRPQNAAGEFVGKKFENISPQEIEKRRSVEKDKDSYYIAGQKASFKSSVAVYQLLVSYYRTPNLTPDETQGETLADLSTWITESWEEAVHDVACYFLYSQTGNMEIARVFQNAVTVWEQDILRSHSYAEVQR